MGGGKDVEEEAGVTGEAVIVDNLFRAGLRGFRVGDDERRELEGSDTVPVLREYGGEPGVAGPD